MTDTDKLREAIAAIFAEDDPFVGIGKSSYDKADRVLALAAAPQPAPVDREALVRLLQIITRNGSLDDGRTLHEVIADALLARGLRLPGHETMAWAVVGKDGKIHPQSINNPHYGVKDHRGERMVRVAIRVVEGGDDAA